MSLNRNKFTILSRVMDNISCYDLNNKDILREVTVRIGLERIDTQEEVTVEALLDSEATGLVMSLEFTKKQKFKLKEMESPIYVRNVDGTFNKRRLIENTVEVIYIIRDIKKDWR